MIAMLSGQRPIPVRFRSDRPRPTTLGRVATGPESPVPATPRPSRHTGERRPTWAKPSPNHHAGARICPDFRLQGGTLP